MAGLALSRVALTPNLYPSRAGLIAMYSSQVRKRLVLKEGTFDPHGWQRHIILFGEDWNSTFPKRIFNALAMFSGCKCPKKLGLWSGLRNETATPNLD